MTKINVDLIYPIGSIYMSVNSTNPSTLFGGTWEQLKDRFLLGAGNTYNNGATGGESSHTLTKGELPNIYGTLPHIAYGENKLSGDFSLQAIGSNSYEGANSSGQNNWRYVLNVGSNQAHNNMPPYLVVYIWKRIS